MTIQIEISSKEVKIGWNLISQTTVKDTSCLIIITSRTLLFFVLSANEEGVFQSENKKNSNQNNDDDNDDLVADHEIGATAKFTRTLWNKHATNCCLQ